MQTLIIGSSTRAMRAQETLGRHGIRSQITREHSASDGCVRGLRVEDGQAERAASILARSGIPVRNYGGDRQ